MDDIKIISVKDTIKLCEVSETTAKRIRKNIRIELKIPQDKPITYAHFKQYFCIP